MNEYTIQNHPHGMAIVGSLPIDDLSGIIAMCGKKGWDVLHPGIADAIGASFVITSKRASEKWLKELQTSGDWLKSGDTGISSKTIYCVLAPKYIHGLTWDVPHDPDDFGRCHRLLERYPEWRDRLPEVAAACPIWGPMVREWSRMTELYLSDLPTGECGDLYELMQKLEAEGKAK